jgi:hypothetical protein
MCDSAVVVHWDSKLTDIPSFALRFRSDLLPLIEQNLKA